jgi:hypothetical protein
MVSCQNGGVEGGRRLTVCQSIVSNVIPDRVEVDQEYDGDAGAMVSGSVLEGFLCLLLGYYPASYYQEHAYCASEEPGEIFGQ